jgi:hypothetical protein
VGCGVYGVDNQAVFENSKIQEYVEEHIEHLVGSERNLNTVKNCDAFKGINKIILDPIVKKLCGGEYLSVVELIDVLTLIRGESPNSHQFGSTAMELLERRKKVFRCVCFMN